MLPPWDDPTPEAWLVHADYLQDQGGTERPGKKQREWLRSLRFAHGLRKRPRMVLIGCVPQFGPLHVAIPKGGQSVTSRYLGCRWITPNYALGRHCVSLDDFAATPLDFPGMCVDKTWRNKILRDFYWKTSYDIRMTFDDNKVFSLDRHGNAIRIL